MERVDVVSVAGAGPRSRAVSGRVSWGLLANGGACLLPLIMAFIVKRYTLPVPFWDEWEWAALVYKMHLGVLRFSDVWQQHNEHRMLFPNLIALGLASLGGWNQMRETLFGLLLVVLTQIGVYLLLRRIVPAQRLPFVFLIASLLLYSPAQMENWTWGFQFGWFLCNAAAVWSLLLLGTAGQSWLALLAATVLTTVASYSLSQGLMIWVAGLATLLFTAKRRPTQIGVWIAAATVVFAGYFHGYVSPAQHPDLLFGVHHPLAAARYIGAYFGALFGAWLNLNVAVAIGWCGIGLLLTTVGLLLNEYRTERAFAARGASLLGLGVFGLSVAAITAAGRTGFGAEQAEASRYTSISMLCWIVIFGLSFAYAGRLSRGIAAVPVGAWSPVLAVLALLYVGAASAGLAFGSSRLAQIRSTFPALAAGTGPQLSLLYPSEITIETMLVQLKSIKEGPYYQ